jgi:hypothetical protein
MRQKSNRLCSICNREYHAKGYCRVHYNLKIYRKSPKGRKAISKYMKKYNQKPYVKKERRIYQKKYYQLNPEKLKKQLEKLYDYRRKFLRENPITEDFENAKKRTSFITSDGMNYSTGMVVGKIKLSDKSIVIYYMKNKGIFEKKYRIQIIDFNTKKEQWMTVKKNPLYDKQAYKSLFDNINRDVNVQKERAEPAPAIRNH